MITAIIQARMNSTRLPNKTLKAIEGKPLLWHLLERVNKSKYIDKIVIATTHNPRDKDIIAFSKEYGVDVYCGDENDVLDRFYQVAKASKSDTLVRLTPDCPLISHEVIDKVIAKFIKSKPDYATNTIVYTYPDGFDVEIFTFAALKKTWKECHDPVGREHVTPYMRNSGKFKIVSVVSDHPIDPSANKWSVDTQQDLEFVSKVFQNLYKKNKDFTVNDILDLLAKRPDIRAINSEMVVNEGYYKSFLKSPRVKIKSLKRRASISLKKRAEGLIPGCSQTFSKSPSQFVQGVSPVFLERGKGSHVWDVDGNEYIDYAMALGPIILGHNYPLINAKVSEALKKGTTFTLPHRYEVELAELLCQIIPCAEMIRYGKNGSDATSGAVRAARGYTSKDKVICCGYHGWQDWYVATTTRDKGIPQAIKELTLSCRYNDIDDMKRIFEKNQGQIACVIMEPVGVEPPRDHYLEKVRELTAKHGTLLIFDEVVTGFRLALGGAQQYYNVIPDLACFGKAIGNGFPISAIVGRRDIMAIFEDIFYSFTAGGEIASIVAAITTIEEMKKKNVISHIWEQGRKIKDGCNVLAREFGLGSIIQCVGLSPRTVIVFKKDNGDDDFVLKSLFQQECIKRGILFTAGHNICFSHTDEDINYTLRVYRTVFEIVARAIKKKSVKSMLKGKPIEPVFRKV